MDTKTINKFKKILEEKRKELLEDLVEETESLKNLHENGVNLVEQYDIVSSNIETVLQESLEKSDLNLLRQIDSAIERIDEGTYGNCADCGIDISVDRLHFIPYTSYCRECAKKKR